MSDLAAIINDLALARSTPQELAGAHDMSIAELADALAAPEHRRTLNNIARLNATHRTLYLDQIKLNVLAKLFDIAHDGGGRENHASAAHSRMIETMRKACVDLLKLGESHSRSSRSGRAGGGGGGRGGRAPDDSGPSEPPQMTPEQHEDILDALEQLGREWDEEDARRFGTDEYIPRYQNPHRKPREEQSAQAFAESPPPPRDAAVSSHPPPSPPPARTAAMPALTSPQRGVHILSKILNTTPPAADVPSAGGLLHRSARSTGAAARASTRSARVVARKRRRAIRARPP